MAEELDEVNLGECAKLSTLLAFSNQVLCG
nr:MAG TPA: hypothetical protein [Caudoviricetes sp.]DAW73422.1 MAG TPA: hypothetical protein [Caudoviricetes sp.]